MESVLYDAAGHRRSPATLPGYHQGRPPKNKGLQYPADPPTVEEIVAVMRVVGDGANGARLRALIVVLLPAGCGSAKRSTWLKPTSTQVAEQCLFANARAVAGGGRHRWAWQQLQPWLELRAGLPVGTLLCVIHGPTAGRHWEQSAARKQLRRSAAAAGVRRRFAPHQLRHAHAIEMAHQGVPLVVIQRQLGHANLGITSIYLQGIDSSETIQTVHSRSAPVISATAGLRAGS